MRESQKTFLELGLCSRLFETVEDETLAPPRVIDQAVVVWRNATRITKTGHCSGYPNPRTVQQQKFGLTGGRMSTSPPADVSAERVRFNFSPYFYPQPYNPEELARTTIPIIYRRRSASEIRMEREENRRSGLRYPTPAEVEEIQRRFHNPELQAVMERTRREYLARMMHLITEPPPRWAQNPDGSLERVD